MNKDEATIKINPIDDIQFVLEDSGCYNEEIEAMNLRRFHPQSLQCHRLV